MAYLLVDIKTGLLMRRKNVPSELHEYIDTPVEDNERQYLGRIPFYVRKYAEYPSRFHLCVTADHPKSLKHPRSVLWPAANAIDALAQAASTQKGISHSMSSYLSSVRTERPDAAITGNMSGPEISIFTARPKMRCPKKLSRP